MKKGCEEFRRRPGVSWQLSGGWWRQNGQLTRLVPVVEAAAVREAGEGEEGVGEVEEAEEAEGGEEVVAATTQVDRGLSTLCLSMRQVRVRFFPSSRPISTSSTTST